MVVVDGLLHPAVEALGNLALSVKVPVGRREELCNIRSLRLDRVPDVVCRDDVTLSALLRLVKAKQADGVGSVGVEELAGLKK